MKYIFIHGLGQTAESWEKTVSGLSLESSDIICVDLIQLLQGKPALYENLYQAFAAYCKEINEPAHLCGLSLGGIIALQFAIEHPANVESLVLIGTQFVMPKGLLKFQNIIFRFMPEQSFSEMGFSKKEFIELSKSMMDLNFAQDLNRIDAKTLILCGEKDSANKKASMELEKRIPHAKLQIVKAAGHEVNVDAPEQLGEILNAFYVTPNCPCI